MNQSWHAPGRVNLIGEHTDYNEGLVLPFALTQGVTVTGARRDDGVLEIRSGDLEARVELADLSPGRITGWAAYVAGVAGCLRAAGHPVAGASLRIASDLPQGAGLSSSAALECATALALTGLYGLELDCRELIDLTRRAEHLYAGVPCGVLDQSASLLCRGDHALLLDCRSGETEQIPFLLGDHRILVIDTGAAHDLADSQYAARRIACERAAARLGLASLREVADLGAALAALDDPEEIRRVRHVVTENRRVEKVVRALRAGDVPRVGPLLTASHRSLRDDYEVSWPEADLTVETVLAAGALGARMIGGGFGGSVIALAHRDLIPALGLAVADAYAARGLRPARLLEAVAGPGARALA
ncbi:galactokinase [Actinocorallia herbida]|uniref:Galactokinase n=2 Tax=Actinocorallia herbida TaxID=58109 RepID=A0A3N1D1M7_9ACTN|nr:galactokinase [Actinocorallia herbida]